MKSVAILLFALIACALAVTETDYRVSFTNWMRKHQRTYHHEEFMTRYAIFKKNFDIVEKNNAENNGMRLGLNKFADLESSEFARYYLGVRLHADTEFTFSEPSAPVVGLPASLDWHAKGAVTPIKNQEQCGSCWSFSTTGSTEGCHFIKTGTLTGLSEQNLMDCSVSYGNNGCNGGLMTDAMQYIIANKGIDTEASYPYTAEDGTCHFKKDKVGATLASFTNVQTGDENDLQVKANVGPVSVAIDASQNSFQLYDSGVYYEPACSSTQLDHGVLVAGWGVSGSSDYWLVKNSWGTSWGLNGYIWMSRNRNNNCGIATMATLPSC